MGRVVHFEITANDMKRAKKFYETFGWKIEDSGMEGTDYQLAKTGEDSIGLDGAIMPKEYNPQPAILWISVDDLDDMLGKVVIAGGKTVGERHSIPGIGETVYIEDTEGNTVGLIQSAPIE